MATNIAWPSDLGKCTIVGRFAYLKHDQEDSNRDPDLYPPAKVEVKMKASVPFIRYKSDQNRIAMVPLEYEGVIDDQGYLHGKNSDGSMGDLGMVIAATDNTLFNPTSFNYQVTVIVDGQIIFDDFSISAPKGQTIDLADAIPEAISFGSLIVVDPTFATRAEAAAKAAKISEDNSLANRNAANTSEVNSKTSETNSKASELAAKASETAAKTSETNAKTSETKAKTSETNSKDSENAAKTAETGSLGNKNAAATSAANALTSETNAKTSETNSKTSETNSANTYQNLLDKIAGTDFRGPGITNIVGNGSNSITITYGANNGTVTVPLPGVSDSDWQNLVLTSGVSSVVPAQYRVIGNVVYFRGILKKTGGWTAGWNVISVSMPSNYYPAQPMLRVGASASINKLLIQAAVNGQIEFYVDAAYPESVTIHLSPLSYPIG